VAARKILLRKIDMEMRKAGLIRDHPKIIRRIALSDKVENYKSMDKVVSNIIDSDIQNNLALKHFTRDMVFLKVHLHIFTIFYFYFDDI